MTTADKTIIIETTNVISSNWLGNSTMGDGEAVGVVLGEGDLVGVGVGLDEVVDCVVEEEVEVVVVDNWEDIVYVMVCVVWDGTLIVPDARYAWYRIPVLPAMGVNTLHE
jgi:hypothetical protein